ncbi:hypothetical protein BD779DRAFT_1470849 [Infundibulicybe gibba]|nr:hypothetical protein BD779DRAFT_1470849 [Infundibulicybe gibba]
MYVPNATAIIYGHPLIKSESVPRPPPLRTHAKIRPKVLAFQLEEDDMVRWSDARDLGGSDDFQKIQRFHRYAPYYLPAPCRQTILHTGSGEYRTGIVVATNFTSREDLELAKDVDRIEKMRVILGVTTPPRWRTPVLSGDDY